MKKVSRFKELMEETKKKVAEIAESVKPEQTAPQELLDLMAETPAVEDEVTIALPVEAVVIEEPKEDYGPYATKEQKERADANLLSLRHPELKVAINVYKNKEDGRFYKDEVAYEGNNLISVKTEVVASSLHMAVSVVKDIFTKKLFPRGEK